MTDCAESASEWSTADVLKLIGCIRRNIPESQKKRGYRTARSAVDWGKVAFAPFSPEECENKWKSVMEKMRRLRSLPELIAEAEEVISDPLRHRKIHPDVPKNTAPPKLVYMWKHFNTLKKKDPPLTMTKMAKIASKAYDELPDEEKAKYERKHTLQLKEYKRKMKDFCKENNLRLSRTFKEKRVPNEDNCLPKKPPPNGLSLFIKEHTKAHHPSLGVGFIKAMGQRWKELTNAERQEYNRRCQEMKSEYYAELMEYLDSVDETEKQQFIKDNGITLPKKPLEKTLPDEPKMPSQTAFIYFAKDQMKLLKEKIPNYADRLAEAKRLWDKLPTKEKERYKEQIHTNMKQYSADLQKWFKTLTAEEQTNYLRNNPGKSLFLDDWMVYSREELRLCQPSDSEDEDIVVISSEEESDIWKNYQDEEEDDMFELYY